MSLSTPSCAGELRKQLPTFSNFGINGPTMRHASQYSWSWAYRAAAHETNFARLDARIDTALTAIEKRLDEVGKLTEDEFKEIQVCLKSLQLLTDEAAR
jgi:hypothetical protein